ncbi:MAG: aquaporin [Bdellovibrionales bacterium]
MLRRLLAEFLGTAFLLMSIIGSGIMAVNLNADNMAVSLLCNSISVGAALVVLITIFAPISGAHFNPAVSLYFMIKKQLPILHGFAYVVTQITAAIIGVILTNLMFDLDGISISQTMRSSEGRWLSEFIATFGLMITIIGTVRFKPDFIAAAVGLYILSAFWFTASTSFANPAVTIGRMFSDSFAGIDPSSVGLYIMMQLLGVIASIFVCRILWPSCTD